MRVYKKTKDRFKEITLGIYLIRNLTKNIQRCPKYPVSQKNVGVFTNFIPAVYFPSSRRVFEAIAQKEGKLMSQSFSNRNWPVRSMITSYFDKMVFHKITRIGVLFL